MTTTADERYRPGFEAWWEKEGQFSRAGGGDYEKTFAYNAWIASKRDTSTDPSAKPVAYAVVSAKGGVHKLCITPESAERKAAKWQEEWPNNGCRVRPLAFAGEAGGALPDEAKDVTLRLEWTAPTPPNKECPYDHVTAQTPFGGILITWKGWKDYPSLTVDEHPIDGFFYVGNDVEDAQREAERAYFTAIEAHPKAGSAK